MAIVVDVGNISGSGDQGNQSTYNWQHTNSVDVKLLVCVVRTRDTSSGDSDISSIVYNGDSFTNGVKLYDAGSDMGVQVWWLANPTADGAGHTLTVTYGGTVSDSSVAAIGLEGAETVAPVDLTDTDVVGSGNVTLDFTGRASGAIAIGGSVLDENTPNKLSVITGTEADEVDMGSYQANSAYNLGDTIVMGSADGDVDFVGAGCTFKEGVAAFDLSVTDGIELSDETSIIMVALPTITDGIEGGDETVELSTMEVAATDGSEFSDTTLGVILLSLAVTDGVKLGDTTLEDMLASPIVTDGFKSGDTTEELGTMEALVSDGVKLGDTTVGALLLLLSLTDGIKLGDLTAETMTTNSIVTDGAKIGDTPLGEMSSVVVVTDGVKLGDTPSGNIVAVVSVTDGLKAGDTTVNILAVYPVVTDGTVFSDTLLIELVSAGFELSVTDGIKIGDTPASEMATFTVISDGVKLGDISIVEMSSEASVSDGVKLGDITVGNINYSVIVSDGFKLGDLATGTLTVAPTGVKNLGQSRELKLYLKMIERMSERRIN